MGVHGGGSTVEKLIWIGFQSKLVELDRGSTRGPWGSTEGGGTVEKLTRIGFP